MLAVSNNNNSGFNFGKEIRASPHPARSLVSRRTSSSNPNSATSTPVLSHHSSKSRFLSHSRDSYSVPSTPTNNNNHNQIEILTSHAPADFLDLVSKAKEGFVHHSPELCQEGVNGTYFLKDKFGKKIAVFKPQDEESTSENNPKRKEKSSNSHSSSQSQIISSLTNLPTKGILQGEAAIREVAAYLLDREQLYGVPMTQIVKITNKFTYSNGSGEVTTKIGSFQQFIDNDGCSEDFGFRNFPVNEVHKIGILDMQILNVDRHAGNILIKKEKGRNGYTLIPIDQGFSLPDNLEVSWFEWMNWPQSKIPFDDDMKSYISRLDVDRDVNMLKSELSVRNECLFNMRIMYALLKKAVEMNLTLYDLGNIVCRKNYDLSTPSILEQICLKAKEESNNIGINPTSTSTPTSSNPTINVNPNSQNLGFSSKRQSIDEPTNNHSHVNNNNGSSGAVLNSTISTSVAISISPMPFIMSDNIFFQVLPTIIEQEANNMKRMNAQQPKKK